MLIELGFVANETCPEIQLDVEVNQTKISTIGFSTELQQVSYELPDDPKEHELKITMFGKKSWHTAINQNGELVRDVICNLSYIRFNQIDVTDTFCAGKQECYLHKFNNKKKEDAIDTFWGLIGCNGIITLNFSTPIFIWLLEHAGQSYDRLDIKLPTY